MEATAVAAGGEVAARRGEAEESVAGLLRIIGFGLDSTDPVWALVSLGMGLSSGLLGRICLNIGYY